MAETVPEATVHEVDEILGSGIDKLKETIANEDEKIDKRIGALLLLLRSRCNVEENMQVDAHPASPQLSESPDFNRPDPKPSHVINVTPEILKASSLSTRRYKLHRRVSLEEINERRLKGLCVFCNELETPNHHLKHKNLGILMIDGDEDQLPNGELSVTIEHRMVNLVQEAREENPKLENHKNLDESQSSDALSEENVVQEMILKEEVIPQFQIPVSNLDPSLQFCNPSLRFCNASPAVCEDSQSVLGFDDLFDHEEAVLVSYVKAKDDSTSVTNNQVAHQLFGKRSQAKERLKLMKKRKGLKSWMFKYKQENERLWRLHKHVLSFPNLCDRRIDRLGTTRKRKLLGGLDSVYVKYFVRVVVDGEVQALLNQDRHELCSENKGCLDCFQALVLNSITDSSSSVEEWMKAEPYFVKVNEMKMEVQIADKEISPSTAVLEIGMEEMIGSHAKRAFVFKQPANSYYQCIEHNLFGTMLLMLQSKKNWMFKFKTSSKDYKLQTEIKRWDVNNRVWDPGGSGFQEFERQAEATMTLWFWLSGQTWMKMRLLGSFQSLTMKMHTYMQLFGSNSCVSSLAIQISSSLLLSNNEAYELSVWRLGDLVNEKLWFQWERLHGSYSMN